MARVRKSDFAFDADLIGFAAPQLLLARDASWSYWDAGTEPGAGWTEPGFNDSDWAVGAAPLGYGKTSVATPLRVPSDRSGAIATTYFRTVFTVLDARTIHGLLFRAWRANGAVVYLNGKEVARWNLLEGPVGADEPATKSARESEGLGFVEVPLAPALLVSGSNELAVELHPTRRATLPVRMELSLVGTTG